MKSLLLVGGGGHCRACIDVIEAVAIYRIVGVVRPRLSSNEEMGYPVIGCDDDLPELLQTSKSAVIAVGQIKSPGLRIGLFNLLTRLGADLPTIVSPRAYCSKYSSLGIGSLLMHNAVVNAGARIGDNCIVNSQALVEHDVVIDDHCHISTGARVNGGVIIGQGSFVGSGAVIKEGITIGENAIIGAGQIVLRDVAKGAVVKNER